MNNSGAYRRAGLFALALVFLASAFPDSGAAKSQGSSRKGKEPSAEAQAAGPGALADAVSGLSDFRERASKFSADEWNFILGYAAFRRGDFKDADELFSKSAGKLPVVVDHVLYYRAASANRLGRPDDALALLDELRAFGGDSVWSSEALLERGRALSSMGRGGEARALFSDYRRRANPIGAFEADKLSVSSYVREGDPSAASQLKRLAVTADCEARLLELKPLMDEVKRRFGEDVASWLEEAPQQIRLADSFAAASQWDEVASRMEKLISSRRLGGGQLSEARWLLARALRWVHRYDEAISLMEGLLRDPNAGYLAGSVMNTLAITYAKKDDYAKAIGLRKKMMESSPPGSARASEMAYKIAFLVMDEGRYDEATGLWRKFLDTRGGGRRDAAEWYLAWSHYMAGRYAEAAALFEAMQKGGRGGKIKDRLKYWRGRALEKDGRALEARAAFASVAREHPAGYYAELSSRRLSNDRRSASDFARAGAASPRPAIKYGEVSVGGSSHLARAAFFDKLGLKEEAARELRFSPGGATHEVLALSARNFAHDVAYRIAEGAGRSEVRGDPSSGGSRGMWEAAYPRAYEPVVARLARGGEVDPMFMWAIMRNESTFRPEVVSPAGAVGLMQIMPATANRMASEVGKSSIDRRDLASPATSLSLGAAYLKKLARLFPQNHAAWAASYNAGEEAVGRWVKKKSAADIEEWIEEIPYDETNLYVKKVLLSYWKYQKIYGR